MNPQELENLSEQEFEALVRAGASGLPPNDGLVEDVTPWRRAMNRALLGIALNLVTLNFWGLNYVLPAIGTLVLLLGFRALRRENGGFALCWYLSLLQAAARYSCLILNASVWQEDVYRLSWMQPLPYLVTFISLLQLFGLRAGLRAARKKAGLDAAAPGTTALIVWYLIIGALALVNYTGFLGWLLVIAYFIILRTLWKLPRQLEEAGYAIELAPVRISDFTLGAAAFGVLAAGITCCYLFAGGYDMDWKPLPAGEQDGLEELRSELLDLGFPEAVLDDLTPEDLTACEGALRVVVDQKDYPLNEGRMAERKEGDTTHYSREYDVNELRITGVAVELPGETEHWRLIHHFEYVADPGFHGTEAMVFWTTDQENGGWSISGGPAGRLLYDRDGQTYTAPYYYFGEQDYQQTSMFFGTQERRDLLAAFSFPARGERQRGYVLYDISELEDGWLINSWVSYIHQKRWFPYPNQTAMSYWMKNRFGLSDSFKVVQTAIQFFPEELEYDEDYGYTVIPD